MRARQSLSPHLAVVVAVAQVLMTQGAQGYQSERIKLDALGYALLLVGPLMLLVRRRYPIAALAVTALVTVVFVWRGYAYGPIFFSPVILLFTTVVEGRRRAAWITAGLTLAFFVIYATWLHRGPPAGWWHNLSVAAVITLILVAAELIRARNERRAEHQQTVEEENRRRASEERLTMAQELHDVLAHNISLIHVQASTALHLIDDHPEQARTALTTIKAASKDVLGEMRSVLNVLREGAPRSPTAGLDRLDDLIERSGLKVTLNRTGARPLPTGVERAAYRIVQESLTNVTKHAPGATVTVRLQYGARELLIAVTDSGSASPAVLSEAGGGNGVPGMRERATALGGTLVAGPSGGGFEVEARLPIPEESE
ncbi:histidine kinase [Nonomuraea sp. NPDC046570]|uniref:sensor histidine kinase n=1 Tax=Nonomuraea sp. NPDC046570 TaxID=3155255 RepID=UPI0033E15C5D